MSRPVAGMPAILVTGRQAFCSPLACLPVRRPSAAGAAVAGDGAWRHQQQSSQMRPERIRDQGVQAVVTGQDDVAWGCLGAAGPTESRSAAVPSSDLSLLGEPRNMYVPSG